ncbi:UNVERIFIED_ORG: hypothetical protein J2W85_005078 [Ensifer adhaerens]|nr:hypothetical protein [Ensifer adhaerens]
MSNTLRHFTDSQLDEFLAALIKQYPGSLERVLDVMRNPLGDNENILQRNLYEMMEVAKTLNFYREFAQQNERAKFLICGELLDKIADTYE